jgi:hypothetical protein
MQFSSTICAKTEKPNYFECRWNKELQTKTPQKTQHSYQLCLWKRTELSCRWCRPGCNRDSGLEPKSIYMATLNVYTGVAWQPGLHDTNYGGVLGCTSHEIDYAFTRLPTDPVYVCAAVVGVRFHPNFYGTGFQGNLTREIKNAGFCEINK